MLRSGLIALIAESMERCGPAGGFAKFAFAKSVILPAVLPFAWKESPFSAVNNTVDSVTVIAPFTVAPASGFALKLTLTPNVVAPPVASVTVLPAVIDGEFKAVVPVPVSLSNRTSAAALMFSLISGAVSSNKGA
jgi:hypothetical protein